MCANIAPAIHLFLGVLRLLHLFFSCAIFHLFFCYFDVFVFDYVYAAEKQACYPMPISPGKKS
jgi:hypothetical protein